MVNNTYKLKIWKDPNELLPVVVVTPYSVASNASGMSAYAVPTAIAFQVLEEGQVIPEGAKLKLSLEDLAEVRKDIDALLPPVPSPAEQEMITQAKEVIARLQKQVEELEAENAVMKQEIYDNEQKVAHVSPNNMIANVVRAVDDIAQKLESLESEVAELKTKACTPPAKRARKPKEKPAEPEEPQQSAEDAAKEIAPTVSDGIHACDPGDGAVGPGFDPFKV